MRSRILAALFVLAMAAPAAAAAPDDDARTKATYPMTRPAGPIVAGVALARVAVPGLHVETRDDRTPERGGIVLAFAGERTAPLAVVRIAVASDAAHARSFVIAALHDFTSPLAEADAAFGDVAYGDGKHVLVGAFGNVAYVVEVVGDGVSADTFAAAVKSSLVPGAPAFPTVSFSVPPRLTKRGVPVTVDVPRGATHRLRARGGYVTRGGAVHSYGPGPVDVTVTIADALGRVAERTVTTQGL